ncbi:UPF0272 protein CHY_1283 [Candidatus Moduliflexus flocculans]|uniref:Putative nickel insertion protein n=1 Tax=Candidatus Moduliflexus flocculans TaxID=1499966 RepID=A0A0S6VSA7_9BACT|nr:UPF0272 protein CHY_1283 [Candidatus Moduliflexus flocculans]
MSKIAYFECFSGASGNMILGALIDAGVHIETLRNELQKLNVTGFELVCTQVMRNGISATHIDVKTEETHAHRHLHHITKIIEQSSLDPQVKENAIRVFTRLAEAEASVHNTTPERIHFHEVGALDAIVDIVGAAIGLHLLGVDAIYVSPFSHGTGFVTCAHGTIPVPAPATVELLKGKPVRQTDIEAELVTPTGAAILSTLGTHFETPPPCQFNVVGYGAGTRELSIPNVLRLNIGELAANTLYDSDTVTVLETNIDDMNPQWFDYVFERLYAAGALEVFLTPAQMKKNRPGSLLTVILPAVARDAAIEILLRETTSIGVRWRETQRAKAQREFRAVETPFGKIAIKISQLGGQTVSVTPEYDECRRAAKQYDVPLKQVYQAALEAFNA